MDRDAHLRDAALHRTAKRRKEIEALLLRRGAREDVFTHAFLGNLPRLREEVVREPSLAQVLIACASQANVPLRGLAGAIDRAAAHENVAIVALLIEHGARATKGEEADRAKDR